MKRKEAVERAKELLGWNYIYGFKHNYNPVSTPRINLLRQQYSSVFTDAYYKKAFGMIGTNAIDCSGLVCYALNIKDIGSWQFHDLPTASPSNYVYVTTPEAGDIVWKSGHVGLCIGNDKVIEARGIDYGVVETNFNERNWIKIISYKKWEEDTFYENYGSWNKDEIGWWFPWGPDKGQYYKNEVATIVGKQYAFNKNGHLLGDSSLITTDISGAILSIDGEVM